MSTDNLFLSIDIINVSFQFQFQKIEQIYGASIIASYLFTLQFLHGPTRQFWALWCTEKQFRHNSALATMFALACKCEVRNCSHRRKMCSSLHRVHLSLLFLAAGLPSSSSFFVRRFYCLLLQLHAFFFFKMF